MNTIVVYVVVLDPQGSMGGFDWFYSATRAEEHADKIGRDLVLGVTHLHVEKPEGFSTQQISEAITDEIDSRLLEIEDRLGYVSPEAGA